jgi:hypothetical protein
MKVYLSSLATNNYELENRVYKSFDSSLKYIYDNLKVLSVESVKDCDFFDRDYVQKYFTEEYYEKFNRVNCKSTFGEFAIKKIRDNKYQFIFAPVNQNYFFVCELEVLELFDQ